MGRLIDDFDNMVGQLDRKVRPRTLDMRLRVAVVVFVNERRQDIPVVVEVLEVHVRVEDRREGIEVDFPGGRRPGEDLVGLIP